MTYDQNILYFVCERELRLSEAYLIGLCITSHHSKRSVFKAATNVRDTSRLENVECELYPPQN